MPLSTATRQLHADPPAIRTTTHTRQQQLNSVHPDHCHMSTPSRYITATQPSVADTQGSLNLTNNLSCTLPHFQLISATAMPPAACSQGSLNPPNARLCNT
ncbi:hypothetical protein SLA2020_429560 [Shorea laevis]